MAGATEAGDDFSVGRTNKSEKRSLLVAINGDPDAYQTDFVLDVSIEGNKVQTKNPDGVDAIHATGTVSFPSAIGTIPEGNGVVGQGLNGLVGYVHASSRNKIVERDVHAGVLGVGGSGSPGLFGRGVNGVVGYENGTARDLTWEGSDSSGVIGNGGSAGVGVRGTGGNGGVEGKSTNSTGVAGISTLSPGVAGSSTSGIGVSGSSDSGPGVAGMSSGDNGGVFQSRRAAQIFLIPNDIGPLNSPFPITPQAIMVQDRGPKLPKNGRGGQLMAVKDTLGACTLWFCVKDGPPARWAQVLVGQEFDGTA